MIAPAHAEPSPWRYFAVWLILLALTTATWLLVYVDRGAAGFCIGLGIAFVKATLVALFFMHLWDQRGINRLVFVVALCFLGILIGLVVADAATRFPLALVRGPALPVPSR
jgi:cytochrome c oxidase subunit IV